MTASVNNTADVTNVKGVSGGYGFSAPVGTAAGTEQDHFATLVGYDNMGFISSDGVEESIEADKVEVTDINGDVIFVAKSKETETIKLTLTGLTAESLKEWHGHANVDDSAAGYTKVTHTAAEHSERSYVFDFVLKDARRWRKHVPNGKVTEVGPIVHGSGSVVAREITITCSPDATGARVYDYIQKRGTGSSGVVGA